MSEALVSSVRGGLLVGVTDDTGVQVMKELLYAKDSFQDEITLASSNQLVSLMP